MKIFTLIPKIMAEVGPITKDRQTQHGQVYNFRGIDDIYLALQGPLSRHGVFFAPAVLEQTREERQSKTGGTLIYTILKVSFTFYADDGSNFQVVTVGEAMDSSDKSTNKAMSAALKYAILQLFCIPTEEEKDTEYQNHEIKPFQGRQAPTPTPVTPKINPLAPVKPGLKTKGDDVPDWTSPPSGVFDKIMNPSQINKPKTPEEWKAHVLEISKAYNWTANDVLDEIKIRDAKKLADMTPNQIEELCLFIKGNPKK